MHKFNYYLLISFIVFVSIITCEIGLCVGCKDKNCVEYCESVEILDINNNYQEKIPVKEVCNSESHKELKYVNTITKLVKVNSINGEIVKAIMVTNSNMKYFEFNSIDAALSHECGWYTIANYKNGNIIIYLKNTDCINKTLLSINKVIFKKYSNTREEPVTLLGINPIDMTTILSDSNNIIVKVQINRALLRFMNIVPIYYLVINKSSKVNYYEYCSNKDIQNRMVKKLCKQTKNKVYMEYYNYFSDRIGFGIEDDMKVNVILEEKTNGEIEVQYKFNIKDMQSLFRKNGKKILFQPKIGILDYLDKASDDEEVGILEIFEAPTIEIKLF